jgi:hypothetical protein
MSTALCQGRQFIVYNEEQIISECIKSNFIDCRLNAYPILLNDDIAAAIQAPNIIFVDIDLPKGFENQEEAITKLNNILEKTVSIIKKKLVGCKPTILWTGNGYHVYIVLKARPLELITELADYQPSHQKNFLDLQNSHSQ